MSTPRLSQKPFNYHYLQLVSPSMRQAALTGKAVPLQLEIHPTNVCNHNCTVCCGQEIFFPPISTFHRSRLFKAALDEAQGKVQRVIISGNRGEPMLFSGIAHLIEAVKEDNFMLGLHSNLTFLRPDVRRLLTASNTPDDYVSIGVSAYGPESYAAFHQPKSSTKEDFASMFENTRQLILERDAAGSPLQVKWVYLVDESNCFIDGIKSIIAQARNIGVDSIRFSAPRQPAISSNYFPELSMISPQYFHSVLDHLLEERDTFPKGQTRINIDFTYTAKRDRLPPRVWRCYFQQLSPTIAADGKVYACCQTAGIDKFAIGDLATSSFWEIWDSAKRHNLLKMNPHLIGCGYCENFGLAVNTSLWDEIHRMHRTAG